MSLHTKRLEDINEADLHLLIENKVAEGKEYDYKLKLPGNSDGDKKEFLADVSSFANTVGGHLIFGMAESEGIPTALDGLSGINIDAEKNRLENILRDGIAPRLTGIGIQPVPTSDAVTLIMRVPKSWSSPHMVTFAGHGKFYARNSAGKYSLDVHELRSAFTLSETIQDNIRRFRTDRLSKIMSEETPVLLAQGAKMVLHLVPLSVFGVPTNYDGATLVKIINARFGEIQAQCLVDNYRHNLDGALCFGLNPQNGRAYSYIQLFRNGSIEYADTFVLREDGSDRIIPSQGYEASLLGISETLLSIQQQLGMTQPIYLMLSLLDVRGYTMGVSSSLRIYRSRNTYPIDRNEVIIPEVQIETFENDLPQLLRPVFDMVWNAGGWSRSMNYDQDGKWVGQR